jgi:hypothetical protein
MTHCLPRMASSAVLTLLTNSSRAPFMIMQPNTSDLPIAASGI